MTMKSEQSRVSGLILGAAAGLATMVVAVPQLALAQNWRPEIAATVASEDAPIVITPPIKPAHAQGKAPANGRGGAARAGAATATTPEPLMLPPGVEQAKAVVITPLGVGDNRPPMVVSSARKAAPVVAKVAPAPSEPIAVKMRGKVWKAREAAKAEATKAEAAKADEVLPTAGMSIDPGGEKAPAEVVVAEPAPSVVPVSAPVSSGDKNHTIIEKSPPQQRQIHAAATTAAGEPEAQQGRHEPVPPASVLAPPEPAVVTDKPETVPAAPKSAATEPEAAPAKAEPAPSAPPVAVAEPAAAAPAPDPVPAAPIVAAAEPEPAPPMPSFSARYDPAPSEPLKTETLVPVLDEMDAPPVMLSSAPTKPAVEPAKIGKVAAADKPNAKGKGRRETGKDSGAGPAKSKPSKGEAKQAAINAKEKPRPEAEDDAPLMITSTASPKPGDRKTRDKPGLAMNAEPTAPARPAAPPLPAPIIGAAQFEPASPGAAAKPETVAVTPATQGPVPASETTPMAASMAPPQHQPAPPAEAADDEAEPQDPFVGLTLAERRGERGEVLTTQVVPTNTPPETTGQATPVERNPSAQYCSNIADAAIDARIAWQRQNLAEAEKQIQARTEELAAKTAEYQRWLDRRDAFSEKAKKTVVDIYTKMKPDAAALQLAELEEETAAAVIVKLDARSASAVMNEMDPEKAARLTSIISGAAKGPGAKGKRPPAGNRS